MRSTARSACVSRVSVSYDYGIIDIKIAWCVTKRFFFFACIFVKTKMAVVSWIVFQLMTKTHQKKTNIPFSQARNTGNEVATFHPRQNAALKNLSQLWTTMLFKLPQKQSKIFSKTDYYNSFFFYSNIISHDEGGWMILMFFCYIRHFFIFDYKQLLINNRLLFKKDCNVKLIVINLIVDEIFNVGCFPYNLSEQKRSIGMRNWFPKFSNSVDTYLQYCKNLQQYFDSHTAEDKVRWWLYHLGLPGWIFKPFSQDRFHPMITSGN